MNKIQIGDRFNVIKEPKNRSGSIRKGDVLRITQRSSFYYNYVLENRTGGGAFSPYSYIVNNCLELINNVKLVGYKLLKDLPELGIGSIGSLIEDDMVVRFPTPPDAVLAEIYKEDTIDEYLYSVAYCDSKPDWFEPIYDDGVKEEEVIVGKGHKLRRVRINSSGKITTGEYEIELSELKELMAMFRTQNFTVSGYGVRATTVHIGCEAEGVEVTWGDVMNIMDVYNNLNPNDKGVS